MRIRFLITMVGAMLLAIIVGVPSAQPVGAAITSIVIDYYPDYIPTNGGSTQSACTTQGTPFAVQVTVTTDVPNENFTAKIRLGVNGACTWNPDSSSWTHDGTAFTASTRGTTDDTGTTTMWLFGRATTIPGGRSMVQS